MSPIVENSGESVMIPIPIGEFITGVKVPVDVYVRLSDQKFVLVAKIGSRTHRDQLMNYKNKTVDYLWVRKDQYHSIAKQNISIAGVLVTSEKISPRQKTHALSAAAKTVFKQFDLVGLNMEVYNQAKQITEATVTLCEIHKDLSQVLASLAECSDELLAHSMAVSLLSVLIGQSMQWENKLTLEKLALGGLLHDIGKKSLSKEILNKPLSQMTPSQIQDYETHAYRGMQMLVSLGVVPDDVVSIVYEHHENSIGQGYPRRIREVMIHPMAKVVGLANEFVNLTLKNPCYPYPKNHREALMYIEHTMGQPFNKEAFKGLQSLINKASFNMVS